LKYPFLTTDEVIEAHDALISRTGGKPGILNRGALDAALAMPYSGIGVHYFHKNAFEMAAAYLFHIGKNHPFVDGNKRTALTTALDFLGLLDYEVEASPTELSEFVLLIIEGPLPPSKAKEEAANFFKTRSKQLDLG